LVQDGKELPTISAFQSRAFSNEAAKRIDVSASLSPYNPGPPGGLVYR
jgi:hypothetical protein